MMRSFTAVNIADIIARRKIHNIIIHKISATFYEHNNIQFSMTCYLCCNKISHLNSRTTRHRQQRCQGCNNKRYIYQLRKVQLIGLKKMGNKGEYFYTYIYILYFLIVRKISSIQHRTEVRTCLQQLKRYIIITVIVSIFSIVQNFKRYVKMKLIETCTITLLLIIALAVVRAASIIT